MAQTGKTLQTKTMARSTPPKCSKSIRMATLGGPPWPLYGDPVSGAKINAYATTVSTQSVAKPTPKPTPKPLTTGSCPSPARLYTKSGSARAYVYGQYAPDWTALLTMKLSVCVSGGKIAWSKATASQRRTDGVTGGPGTPFYIRKSSTVREAMVTTIYNLPGYYQADPVVIIGFKVGTGFYRVTLGDQMFH